MIEPKNQNTRMEQIRRNSLGKFDINNKSYFILFILFSSFSFNFLFESERPLSSSSLILSVPLLFSPGLFTSVGLLFKR